MKFSHIIIPRGMASFNIIFPFGVNTFPELAENLHLIEHLIFHGHPQYDYYALLSQFECEGGIVNASVDENHVVFYGRTHPDRVNICLELLIQCIVSFSIDQKAYYDEIKTIALEKKGASVSTYIIREVNRLAFPYREKKKKSFLSFDEIIELEHMLFQESDMQIVVAAPANYNPIIHQSTWKAPMKKTDDLRLTSQDLIICNRKMAFSAYFTFHNDQLQSGLELLAYKAALVEGFSSIFHREMRKRFDYEPYKFLFFKNQIVNMANSSIIFIPGELPKHMNQTRVFHEIIDSYSFSDDELIQTVYKTQAMLELMFENIGRGVKYMFEYEVIDKTDETEYNEIKKMLLDSVTPSSVRRWMNIYFNLARHIEIHSIEKTA